MDNPQSSRGLKRNQGWQSKWSSAGRMFGTGRYLLGRFPLLSRVYSTKKIEQRGGRLARVENLSRKRSLYQTTRPWSGCLRGSCDGSSGQEEQLQAEKGVLHLSESFGGCSCCTRVLYKVPAHRTPLLGVRASTKNAHDIYKLVHVYKWPATTGILFSHPTVHPPFSF